MSQLSRLTQNYMYPLSGQFPVYIVVVHFDIKAIRLNCSHDRSFILLHALMNANKLTDEPL